LTWSDATSEKEAREICLKGGVMKIQEEMICPR